MSGERSRELGEGWSRDQSEPSVSAGVQGRLPRGGAAECGLKVGLPGRILGEGRQAGLKAWAPGSRGIWGPSVPQGWVGTQDRSAWR